MADGEVIVKGGAQMMITSGRKILVKEGLTWFAWEMMINPLDAKVGYVRPI